MQKCQTHYMGRAHGWHLAAGGGGVLPQPIPQEPHAESVYREERKEGGGESRYCLLSFCFAAGGGLSCAGLGAAGGVQ